MGLRGAGSILIAASSFSQISGPTYFTRPALSQILKPRDQEIGEFCEVQEHCTTEFEASKL